MAKIDELKAYIDWLKDAIKILTALLIAIGAGVSKLYIDDVENVLLYLGIFFIIVIGVLISLIITKIHKTIKKLREQ